VERHEGADGARSIVFAGSGNEREDGTLTGWLVRRVALPSEATSLAGEADKGRDVVVEIRVTAGDLEVDPDQHRGGNESEFITRQGTGGDVDQYRDIHVLIRRESDLAE
jgi:hypothetical protein